MDRAALADFLRRRRLSLQPAAVGLPDSSPRRTAGLRREEVARLAHISTNFYTRLEQGRGSRPSLQTTSVLADALRLTQVERDYLMKLAGHSAPQPPPSQVEPSPELVDLLSHIDIPAQIVTDLGVTLAQNPMARALVGDQTVHDGPRRSIIYRWFTDPRQRAIHPASDRRQISRSHVASLRAVLGSRPTDQEAVRMLTLLQQESAEFRALWDEHEVSTRSGMRKRFVHPVIGTVTLNCHILTSADAAERLVVFSPAAGSNDEVRLATLLDLKTAVG